MYHRAVNLYLYNSSSNSNELLIMQKLFLFMICFLAKELFCGAKETRLCNDSYGGFINFVGTCRKIKNLY